MTDGILEKVLKIDGKVSISHSFVDNLNRLKNNMKIGQMVNVNDLPENAKSRILNYFSSGKLTFDDNVYFDGCSISFEEYLTLKNPETDIINVKSFKGDIYIDCLDDFEIGIEQYRRVKNKMDKDIRKRFKKK